MKKSSYAKLFAEIHEQLDTIESYMIWLIAADVRFRKGQRVRFSRRAIRNGVVAKTRTTKKGTVLGTSGFTVRVQMDDRKHPHAYHHAFFNPVSGPKLF